MVAGICIEEGGAPAMAVDDAPDVLGELRAALGDTPHLGIEYEPLHRTLVVTMAPRPFPRLTAEMADSFLRLAAHARSAWGREYPAADQPVKFLILRSDTPSVFSTGGDLPSILRWVEAGDWDSLRTYFHAGTRCFHDLADGFGACIVTVAATSGMVYGGGLEAARACDFIVSDETVRIGFPEWRFGVFPGNGAFSLVGLRHGEPLLKRLVLDGDYLDAGEALQVGLLEKVVRKGGADEAARDLVAKMSVRHVACVALRRSMQRLHGLSVDRMLAETDQYLSAVRHAADVTVMRNLVAVQEKVLSRVMA